LNRHPARDDSFQNKIGHRHRQVKRNNGFLYHLPELLWEFYAMDIMVFEPVLVVVLNC
jgi:hypothetical protein